MITLYDGNTPNVFKVTIALEELGLAYERVPVDIFKGEQFTPEFLKIAPNNRIPAIVDHDPAGGGEPIPIFESGAILIYLAEKTGQLLPTTPHARAQVLQWLMWQMAGQGPMWGQAGHFLNYAPEKIPYAIERYTKEVKRLNRVLDGHLAGRTYIGDAYSIADIACWPWILWRSHHAYELDDYPNMARWHRMIEQRPAVQKAMGDFKPSPPQNYDPEIRRLLFGQDTK